MRRGKLLLLAYAATAGCASTGPVRRQSGLTANEAATIAGVKEKDDDGFARAWRDPKLGGWRFMKWDEDRSRTAIKAPRDLLQTLRDELGRLNRYEGEGADLYLGVTVLRFRPAGLFKRPAADLELVARDGYGRMMWAATGPVEANRDLAESLADTDSVLIAREVLRKVRAEIRRVAARK